MTLEYKRPDTNDCHKICKNLQKFVVDREILVVSKNGYLRRKILLILRFNVAEGEMKIGFKLNNAKQVMAFWVLLGF